MAKCQQRANITPPETCKPKQLYPILDDVHGNDGPITGGEESIRKSQKAEEEEIGIPGPKEDTGDQDIANKGNCAKMKIKNNLGTN
jgi:hypothetical protein